MNKEFAFRPMNLEEDIQERKKEKGEVITIWLNPQDRIELNKCKEILQQKKDGTAIKQLYILGSKLLGGQEIRSVLEIVLNNYRKNKRLGIVDFD